MTHTAIPALAFIGVVFACAAGARVLLRAALVTSLVIRELSRGRPIRPEIASDPTPVSLAA